jgi:hypothetical protein
MRILSANTSGASIVTLCRRMRYGGRKGRSAARRYASLRWHSYESISGTIGGVVFKGLRSINFEEASRENMRKALKAVSGTYEVKS